MGPTPYVGAVNEQRHPGHHLTFDSPAMAAATELEGDVLLGLASEAISMLAELCRQHGATVRRVLDLGSGPGVGTCALAQRFASATVVAVDGSATMVAFAAARAQRLGLAARVETRQVEFPAGLDTLGRADVAWASMSLHHIGDETGALGRIRRLLQPRGLIAIVERAGPSRVLPEDADSGRPGLWTRLDAAWAAWFADMRADLPGATTSADYPEMLGAGGFEVLADEVLTITVDPPLDASARRFALQQLVRMQTQLVDYADAADLEALRVLLDASADAEMLGRADAYVRASRHLYIARANPT